MTGTKPFTKQVEEAEIDLLDKPTHGYHLIVWNDDVNTFDWVIETLIQICNHSFEQAEQCALLIHSKGKYAVKNGDFDTLRPLAEGIIDRGINATVESAD
jgi:ATP-dependent Clp protease adaptor protein ClpS